MSKRILLAILTAVAVLPAAASTKVHEFKLDNGLKLVVKEDHRAPVVVSQVWYKVGSSYEHSGITGISHVLEHMMFKGTKKHPPGEFSRIIAANGGQENAFTSRDYTAYFQNLEESRLKVSFELEADRMRNLLLPEQEFAKEVRVVMEERRMRVEDKPDALAYERFNATAFVASPYRIPTIGWENDLDNLKVGDLTHWYRKWYAPNNATVVVVGDVDPQEVLKLAQKYFAPLKPEKVVPPKPQVEPAHYGVRRLVVERPARLPYLVMGYKVPVLKTGDPNWEAYALEVLSGILDSGDSSRLPSRVVRGSGIASGASASYNLYSRMDDMFLLEATPAEGKSVADVEKALLEQIEDLRNKPVDKDELERVKAQVVASNVYQRDSVFYQAMQIGILETVGLDWRVMDEYVDRVRAVTPEQVQAVAKKYLDRERLTVGVLKPLPMTAATRPIPPAMPGGRNDLR